MSQSTENVRVRRTRKLLRQALVELIEEHGFERLTVGEITERAMVSRAAFYRNYRDKYHLVEQIFDEAMGALLGSMNEGEEKEPLERWVAFFEHIAQYQRLYAALLGRKGSPWFAIRMQSSLSTMVTEHLQASPPSNGLVSTLLGAMFVQAITWWLDKGMPSSPREIATQTAQLAAALIAETNRWGTA